MKSNVLKTLRSLSLLLTLILIMSTILTSFAFFTDNVQTQVTVKTDISISAGYKITRDAPGTPFIANENIRIPITESHTAADNTVESIVRMGVVWNSPDTSVSVFGNANAEDNATISIGGQKITYTKDPNVKGKYIFDLPAHTLTQADKSRELVFHIPNSLYSTGTLDFTFEKVTLNAIGSSLSETIDRDKLNAEDELDFTEKVGWAASSNSANNGKNLMGYLFIPNASKPSEFGINFDFEFGASSSGMKDFTSKTDAKWSHYSNSTVELSFEDNILTIGDYAFPDFVKIRAVDLPENLTAVGTWAFDNTSIETLIIPSKVESLGTMSFGHINELTEITFNGSTEKDISFPEKAGSTTGAFYVYPYVDTVIKGTNTDALAYDWIKDLRNPPTLAPSNSWIDSSNINSFSNPVTKVYFVTNYTPTGNETETWNAAVDRDGDGNNDDDIICYLNGTELTFYAHTCPKIFANEDSSSVFEGFYQTTSFDNIEMLDTRKATNMNSMFSNCMSVTDLEVGHFDTKNVTDISYMFYINYNVPALDVSKWDTGKVERMVSVFSDCNMLADLNGIRNWDTQNVTSMASMFDGCESMTSLDLSSKEVIMNGRSYDSWDTGKVTNMSSMFGNTDDDIHLLKDLNISTFDTRNVTTMKLMFNRLSSIEELDVTPRQIKLNGRTFYTWDTGKVQTMYGTFGSCTSLKTLDLSGWDTASIGTMGGSLMEDFYEMFMGCTNLETLNVSRKPMTNINGRNYTSWNTSNAVYMNSMFEECNSLTSLNLKDWNNASAKEMDSMFYNCVALEDLNLSNFTTPSLTSASSMFNRCSSLEEIDVSSFDTSKLKYFTSMFRNCTSLKTLDISNFSTEALLYPNSIRWFAHNCPNLTTIVFGPDFGQSGKTPPAGSSEGMFYVSNALETYIIGANDVMKAYGWATDNRTVTYHGVKGIAVTTPPTTTQYNGGEDFDSTGMVVTVTYTDNTTKQITNFVVVDGTNLASGKTSVTLSYSENGITVTTTVPISVVSLPTMKAQDSWFEGCSVTVDKITKIIFKTSGAPASYNEAWAADVDSSGSIMAYRSGTTITIVGNGSPKIMANADSSDMFNGWSVDSSTNGEQFTSLSTIEGLSILDTSNVTNMSGMFEETGSLTGTVDLSSWDTSKVTDMSSMFRYSGLSGLITPDGFGSACTTMKTMFSECTRLQSMDVRHWDTKNVENMQAIFDACTSLTSINMSGLDTSSLTTAKSFAYGCTKLKTVDLSGWDTSKLTITYRMFYQDAALTSVDLRGWDLTSVDGTSSSGGADMFRQCYPDTPFTLTVSSEAMKTWVQNTKNFTLAKYVNIVVDTSTLALNYDPESDSYSGFI